MEKKGFQDLLQALLIVKERGERFQCAIYGDGPLGKQLEEWIEEHDMTGEVMLKGDRTQQELISVLSERHSFYPYSGSDGGRRPRWYPQCAGRGYGCGSAGDYDRGCRDSGTSGKQPEWTFIPIA